jgi:hypothetical protein
MSEYEGIPDDDIWNIQYEDMEIKEEIAGGSFGKGIAIIIYKYIFLFCHLVLFFIYLFVFQPFF